MTFLKDKVHVARRFQRSIRIDTDINDAESLTGFQCPASSIDALLTMARHVEQSGHTAFTWTGPYGSGKSSLVLAFCSALASKPKVRDAACGALGKETVTALNAAMPVKSQGWRVLPVVARRAPMAQLIGEALESAKLSKRPPKEWTDAQILNSLATLSAEDPKQHGGLVVIIDEMGKALEGAAHDGHDIYLLQQLAELASRSNRRLILVGILHQAFDEYAQRLAREVRDEWAKVQGRFVDLVINASGDEQLELLSRAIETSTRTLAPHDAVTAVSEMVRHVTGSSSKRLQGLLTSCWPLHPVVASLVGPLSRRRFGQNQRSLFAFLNSAEPRGFREFLSEAKANDLYMPDRLWGYLRINLEPAILASPDGHRWAIGIEALERCNSASATGLEHALLKTIIIIDLLRERSGVSATPELLKACAPKGSSVADVTKALKSLAERSCIVFRKHLGAFALYAGSDFDIDDALASAMPEAQGIDLTKLRELAGLQPLLAKRHYHETGAIRWFNLDLVSIGDLAAAIKKRQQAHEAAGRFLIAIPTHGESPSRAKKICAEVAAGAPGNVIVGLSDHAWHVVHLAREFKALTIIHDERPELRGDSVARREVIAHLNEAQGRLDNELQRMVDATLWFRAGVDARRYSTSDLNALSSEISDELYAKGPRIHNELLNRDFPSSNAVKAQRDLMKRMLDGAGKPRLGLNGWPTEAGLMESILVESSLYRRQADEEWVFVAPQSRSDPARLAPLWQAALKVLKSRPKSSVSLADIYDVWRRPPFGMKEGLMPIIALVLYITQRDWLAVYRNGAFVPEMTEFDVDLLTSDPAHIHFRWMELSDAAQEILRGLAATAAHFDKGGRAGSGKPLDVARSLVAAFDRLPEWTKRTASLSPRSKRLAHMLRYASDPNRLLFDDVPGLVDGKGKKAATEIKETISVVKSALGELQQSYPNMLADLKSLMLAELEAWSTKLGDLRDRAINMQHVTGDLRLEAFINRLASYNGTDGDMEGIASLALGKKPTDWVDADVSQAKVQISELAQAFKRHEEIGRVAGRSDTRLRMAVIVPREDGPRAMHIDFAINAHDDDDVKKLIAKLDEALRATLKPQNIILAALAQVSAKYMEPSHTAAPLKRKAG